MVALGVASSASSVSNLVDNTSRTRRTRRTVKELQDDAVVLRTYKSGEADRVVVLWTRHYGKVRVLAKGIRKATSRLGGNLETLAYVNVDLVKTRASSTSRVTWRTANDSPRFARRTRGSTPATPSWRS